MWFMYGFRLPLISARWGSSLQLSGSLSAMLVPLWNRPREAWSCEMADTWNDEPFAWCSLTPLLLGSSLSQLHVLSQNPSLHSSHFPLLYFPEKARASTAYNQIPYHKYTPSHVSRWHALIFGHNDLQKLFSTTCRVATCVKASLPISTNDHVLRNFSLSTCNLEHERNGANNDG